jgi:outer membrane protein assembly factor BamB
LRWSLETPPGSSSPIIADGRVFITGHKGNQRLLWCVNLESGFRLWETEAEAERAERKSAPNDPASSTPVIEGVSVYALFSGFGLISYHISGRERWRQPLKPFNQPHGMSSSPIFAGDNVILLVDQVTNSFLAAFENDTGKLQWKTARPNFVGGYSTPVLFRDSLLISGPAEAAAYSLSSGERLWSAPKMGIMPVASPVVSSNRLYVVNGAVPAFESLARDFKADKNGDGKLTPDEFPDPSFKEAVLAIDRVYGNGDGAVDKAEWDGALKLMQTLNALVAVEVVGNEPRELWRTTKFLNDVSSPLLYQDVLYLLKDGGLLSALSPDDGRILKQERIEGATGRYFSSPVAGDGKIYTASESGKIAVIQPGADWKLLALNDLKDECYATPAISDGCMVVRTAHKLWCFEMKEGSK